MNTKEIESVRWLYSNAVGALIERQQHEKDYPKEVLNNDRINSLYNVLVENEILSAYLLGVEAKGISELINKLENDIFLSERNSKIYFAGTPVELEQFIERVLIQYIPIGNLGDEDKRKQRELLNVREKFIPDFEEALYRLLLRYIENKNEKFSMNYDDVRFKTALIGLSRNELTAHHFSGKDEKSLKALFVSIGQDDGYKSVNGKLQYQGINIEVNDLLRKVIVHHIPENDSQSFTSVQYTANSSSSSSNTLLTEMRAGFAEFGGVVVDFFRTFLTDANQEQANGRQN